jgi:type I site-specific restriction endonuclease
MRPIMSLPLPRKHFMDRQYDNLNESDTRAKLIDPALHGRCWNEDYIKREESASDAALFL